MKRRASVSVAVQVSPLPSNSQLRQLALSRWDDEGGARAWTLEPEMPLHNVQIEAPPLTNAELVQLHIRIIALERLVTTLLAAAPDRQLMLAREMAVFISPRPGATQHPATIRAAAQMLRLIEQAQHFRS